MKRLLLIGLICFSFQGCKKDEPKPTADFVYSGGGCIAPCQVVFDNKSKDADKYTWTFGDGGTSTEANPIRTYMNPGVYNVTLNAQGKGGSTSITKSLEIKAPIDICAGVNCQNGGHCVNGDCVCPEGYTGSNCSQQKTPTKIRINSIMVTGWNTTDNGSNWDFTDGPDIYVMIKKGTTVLYDGPYDENSIGSVSFDCSVDINNPLDQYSISIFDFDTPDADDYMGGYTFLPYTSSNGFPETLYISNSSVSNLEFALDVSYYW